MNSKGLYRAAILLAVLCVLPATAFATAQTPDVLIHKGKTYDLFANPLEAFYKGKKKKRPTFVVSPDSITTSNWRGYVATWTIEDGFLYLVKIDAWFCTWDSRPCKRVDLAKLFGQKYRDGKVKADWFSGDLRMPEGELLQYVHMGYGSIYEREITLTVNSGKVVKESTVDNTKRFHPSTLELERRELEKMRPKPR